MQALAFRQWRRLRRWRKLRLRLRLEAGGVGSGVGLDSAVEVLAHT